MSTYNPFTNYKTVPIDETNSGSSVLVHTVSRLSLIGFTPDDETINGGKLFTPNYVGFNSGTMYDASTITAGGVSHSMMIKSGKEIRTNTNASERIKGTLHIFEIN